MTNPNESAVVSHNLRFRLGEDVATGDVSLKGTKNGTLSWVTMPKAESTTGLLRLRNADLEVGLIGS